MKSRIGYILGLTLASGVLGVAALPIDKTSTAPVISAEQKEKVKDYISGNKDFVIKLQNLQLQFIQTQKDQEAYTKEMQTYIDTVCTSSTKKYHVDLTTLTCAENSK